MGCVSTKNSSEPTITPNNNLAMFYQHMNNLMFSYHANQNDLDSEENSQVDLAFEEGQEQQPIQFNLESEESQLELPIEQGQELQPIELEVAQEELGPPAVQEEYEYVEQEEPYPFLLIDPMDPLFYNPFNPRSSQSA